jgi:putative Ca2+/H+ antiporter (TMEM165/GDT1 family)
MLKANIEYPVDFYLRKFLSNLSGEYDAMELSKIQKAEKLIEEKTLAFDPYLQNSRNEGERSKTTSKERPRGQMKTSFLHEFGYSVLFFFLLEIGGRSFIMIVVYSARVNWTTIYLISICTLCILHTVEVSIGGALLLLMSPFLMGIVSIVGYALVGGYMAIQGTYQIYKEYPEDKDIYVELEDNILEEPLVQNAQNNNRAVKERMTICYAICYFFYKTSMQFLLLLVASSLSDRSRVSVVSLVGDLNYFALLLGGYMAYMTT